MKNAFYISAAIVCTIFASGCCKSIMDAQQKTDEETVEIVVEDDTDSQGVECTASATDTKSETEPEASATEPTTNTSGDDAKVGEPVISWISWISFSISVILIGWLVSKFVLRKK